MLETRELLTVGQVIADGGGLWLGMYFESVAVDLQESGDNSRLELVNRLIDALASGNGNLHHFENQTLFSLLGYEEYLQFIATASQFRRLTHLTDEIRDTQLRLAELLHKDRSSIDGSETLAPTNGHHVDQNGSKVVVNPFTSRVPGELREKSVLLMKSLAPVPPSIPVSRVEKILPTAPKGIPVDEALLTQLADLTQLLHSREKVEGTYYRFTLTLTKVFRYIYVDKLVYDNKTKKLKPESVPNKHLLPIIPEPIRKVVSSSRYPQIGSLTKIRHLSCEINQATGTAKYVVLFADFDNPEKNQLKLSIKLVRRPDQTGAIEAISIFTGMRLRNSIEIQPDKPIELLDCITRFFIEQYADSENDLALEIFA
jgi:hypothetical protein